jgi:signal transduction histidine kinase
MVRRLSFQIMTPVILLLAGMMVMVVWIGIGQGRHARSEALQKFDHLGLACSGVTIPRSRQILNVMRDLSGAELILCNASGLPLSNEQGELLATVAITSQLPDLLPDSTTTFQTGNQRWLARHLPWGAGGQFWVLALLDLDTLERSAWNAMMPVMVTGATVGFAGLAMAWILASGITHRFAVLMRQTARIAQGDYTPMDLPTQTAELEDLSRSINLMAAHLNANAETLRQSERASLIGQIGAGMAHQIRNAATGARLAIQLHARATPGSPAEDLRVALRQLELIEMQVRQLLELGRTRPRLREQVDPRALIDDAVELVAPRCRHTGTIMTSINPTPHPEMIMADGDALRLVLINLLTNAMEAAGPGGSVEISMQEQRGQKLAIKVRDNGPGPSPALIPRLFEPFATGKSEGVGLGLAVARRVAREHGGDVTWHRDADTTVFTLTVASRGMATGITL